MSEFPSEFSSAPSALQPTSNQLVLSRTAREVELGGTRTVLKVQAFAILELLARQAPEAVDKTTIAKEIGLYSRVDLDGAVRVHISTLRGQLRAAGFPEIVIYGPGRAYRLADWVRTKLLETVGTQGGLEGRAHALSTDARKSGRGPVRRRTLDVVATPSPEAEEYHLLGDPDRLPVGIVLTRFGLVDSVNRVIDLGSGRLTFATLRDFEFVAAVMRGDGAEVEEASLLALCKYAPGEFGPQVLRRTSRRLNAHLAKVGAPFRIEPRAKSYGSPYSAVPAIPGQPPKY